MRTVVTLILALMLSGAASHASGQESVRVGSKNFGESYLLAEMFAQLLEAQGLPVERQFGLGGTLICYGALINDEIDVYPEYTGTITQAILKLPADADLAALHTALESTPVRLLQPLGFNNSYAIVLQKERAQALGLRSIGDLARHTDLRVVVSHEFLERGDGWQGLAATYGLTQAVTGIEHGLAYRAIAEGAIDATDAYTTDGELARYDLQVLTDDAGYFPRYLAAPLVRRTLPADAVEALNRLHNRLTEEDMQRLNGQVTFAKRSFADVAHEHLLALGLLSPAAAAAPPPGGGMLAGLWKNTLQHLKLTGIALGLAIVVGLLVSFLVYRNARTSAVVLYVCSLLQTIPSIALLALMIPLLGIGEVPAIAALFLYSLLPIVRNTLTALTSIDGVLVRVAQSMGLTPRQQLRHVYLPLSLPAVFAGVRTAAVISIGTATLAAFIGAGGLGDPIVTGLSLNDVNLVLQGAIPAACLAIVTELVFEFIERRFVPAHLRDSLSV